MPRVSVIMSVYNCNNFEALKESIFSIIKQTFTDWELIIYNDGSKDNGKTTQFLNKIKYLDKRIRIIDNPENKGLAYAKNQMIKVATGEYITAQDDDDISIEERLAKEVEFLDHHLEYAFVGTLATVFDHTGIWGHYDLKEKPTKYTFLWNSPFLHPSVMFRKEVFDKVGGYRISWETTRAEDYDLFMHLYSLGYQGYNIQEDLYEYRIENDPNKKYRPMKSRLQETKVRWQGFKKLGILTIGLPYVVKPVLIGLIPQKIFYLVRKKQY